MCITQWEKAANDENIHVWEREIGINGNITLLCGCILSIYGEHQINKRASERLICKMRMKRVAPKMRVFVCVYARRPKSAERKSNKSTEREIDWEKTTTKVLVYIFQWQIVNSIVISILPFYMTMEFEFERHAT